MTYTRPALGDPGNSGPTSAVTIIDALSDGLEALEAAGSGSVLTEWVAGTDYPVGKVVTHEGDAWILTAEDTANGLTTKVSVQDQQSRDVAANAANQSWSGEAPLLLDNEVYLCFVIYSQTAAQNVTASTGTEVSGSAVNMNYDGKNTGVKVFYSDAVPPTVNLNGGTGRIVWVRVQGVNTATGPTAVQTSAAAQPTNTNNIRVTSTTGADGSLGLVATSFARSSGGARGWVGQGGDFGVRVGRGHAFESSGTAVLDDKWVPWVSAFIRDSSNSNGSSEYSVSMDTVSFPLSGSAQRVASVVHLVPATNAHPFFDRSKWKRLTGDARPTETVAADDVAFGLRKIRLPEPDKTYTVTLSARTSGTSGGTTTIYMPELSTAERTTHHTVRVVAKVENARRMLVFQPSRPIAVTANSQPTTGVIYSGPFVEFGSEPGSHSWVDLNFDPEFQAWSVVSSGGDRIIRNTAIYTEERRGNVISEVGFPLYFTPEVTSSQRTQTVSTLMWIPQGVRRIMGSDGNAMEVGGTLGDTSWERVVDTDNSGTYVLGYADSVIRMAFASPAIQNGVEGWVALHEFGHLVDKRWVSAMNNHKRFQGEPWASIGSLGYDTLRDAFYDELNLAYNNSGVYAYGVSDYGEYFAEIFATSICAQRYADTGSNYSAFSTGKTGIVGTGDPDNLWPGIETKMKSFGLITYSGNVT